jgi:hypothetical protein
MPVSSGPDLLGENNLAFGYDTGDVTNSYKGAPTTNICTGADFSIFNDNATNVRNQSYPPPPIPGYEVVKVSSNTPGVYGQSILWRAGYSTSPATATNSVYAWLESGTFVQVGQHWFPWNYGSAKTIERGKWVRISETYNINEGGSYGEAAMAYATNGVAYFCMPQYELKPYMTPFVNFLSTRSETQGLLPLVGTNTIDLTNVSFDSNAQMVFDGTNDYLTISDSTSLQFGDVFTVNAWVNPTNLNARYGVFTTRRFNTAGSWQFEVGTASGGTNRVAVTGLGTWIFETPNNVISPNVWTNICFVKPGNGVQGGILYINGNVISPLVTTPYNILNNSDVKVIGSGTNLGQFFPGRIANVSLYNRILTSTEVRNNYSDFKTRFNLS